MAIADKGYGDSAPIGFDTTLVARTDESSAEFMKPDTMKTGTHYLEVVSLDVFESGDRDFLKIWLFDPRTGLVTEMFGELKKNTMWKLERAIRGTFGKMLPLDKVQGPSGRMPVETRTNALGVYVKVEIKNSDYEGQDVLIVGDQGYQAPDGVSPMFDSATHEPTGSWPTTARGLIEKRGGTVAPSADAVSDDSEDW